MLVVTHDFDILHITFTNSWTHPFGVPEFRDAVSEIKNQNKQVIMHIITQPNCFPSTEISLRLIATAFSMRNELNEILKYTIIHANHEKELEWVKMCFNLYTPVKNVYYALNNEQYDKLVETTENMDDFLLKKGSNS